jgi:beta-phosphoglucomutase-like phosphatase (HAD superfamily)
MAPLQTRLDDIGLRRYFAAVVAGDMVTQGKPDPEIFLVAAAALRAEPARCVVFEDSPAGVLAASRAGMYAIAVCAPSGPVRGAHFTVGSLAEVFRALRVRTIARAARPGGISHITANVTTEIHSRLSRTVAGPGPIRR